MYENIGIVAGCRKKVCEKKVKQIIFLVRGPQPLICKVSTPFFTPIKKYTILCFPAYHWTFPRKRSEEYQARKYTCLGLLLGLWGILLLVCNGFGNACHVKATTGWERETL